MDLPELQIETSFWNHHFLQINQKQEAFVERHNPGTCRSLDLPPTQYHFNG